MNQVPAVSFIICTYNRASYLDDTLRSLQKFSAPDFSYEILVIDNNSTDETPKIIDQHREIALQDDKPFRSFKETTQGLSHARNRGISESKADCIVFFDDDIRATKSLIPAWCSFFKENPNAIAAGGKIHVQFDAQQPNWMSHFLLPLLGHHDLGNKQTNYPSGKYPFGGNMGFRKSIFKDIGFFDTTLGRKGQELNAGEEKELFQRIRNSSHQIVYLPDALLFHRVDSNRLTKKFIREQAMGLGQALALSLKKQRYLKKMEAWLEQLLKFSATLVLFIAYSVGFQLPKAILLIKFRWWIWKGYSNLQ